MYLQMHICVCAAPTETCVTILYFLIFMNNVIKIFIHVFFFKTGSPFSWNKIRVLLFQENINYHFLCDVLEHIPYKMIEISSMWRLLFDVWYWWLVIFAQELFQI